MAKPIQGAKPKDYALGTPSQRDDWTELDCQPLSAISHVTHIRNAVAIAREGALKPRLVWDESCLNQTRTLVTWLSPNDWVNGSRYGHIQFVFDWNFHANRDAYWVEAVNYKQHACRILLTNPKALPSSLNLTPYDPTKWAGPWGVDSNGQHWWNGKNICLEILLHDEIPAKAVRAIEFVKHHPDYCSLNRTNPAACQDINIGATTAAGMFVAALVAESLHGLDHALRKGKTKQHVATDSLQYAWANIRRNLSKGTHTGNIVAADIKAPAFGRSLLAAFARNAKQEFDALLSIFSTTEDATEVVRDAVAGHFDVAQDSLEDAE